MTARSISDPASNRRRSCRISPDLFYPAQLRGRHIVLPQRLCRECPLLSECAAWAEPLVRSGVLHGCVVASVAVPQWPVAKRDACADALADIATDGTATELGGAA